MSKENNLKDYLTDLYDGISSKKPDASRNPQNFRAEIEAIKTGGIPWDGDYTIEGDALPEPPKAYHLTSVDELPDDAVDGSLAVVGEEFYIREKGKWVKGGSDTPSGMVVCNYSIPNMNNSIYHIEQLSVSYPNAEILGVRAFLGCTSLIRLDLPNVTEIAGKALNGCTALTSINLPNVTSIGEDAFNECISLASIDLPNVTSIGAYAFEKCTALTAFILRTTKTVCVIDLTAFNESPFLHNPATGTNNGHIYVPSVMYEYYRAGYEEPLASVLGAGAFDRIVRKIEDYPEICG